MSNIARFAQYAAAFEESYASDDWAALEPFFAENAVYDTGSALFFGGRCDGRDEILGYFKRVLDGFDRRFERRDLSLLEGPFEEGPTVRIRGSATYRAAGVPELVLILEEHVTFEGDRIIHLEDRYDDEMQREFEAWLATHGPKLGIALDDA
jgi:hypothetical protein